MDIDRDGLDDIIVALTEVIAIINEIKKRKESSEIFSKCLKNCTVVLYMVYVVMIVLYYNHFELNNLYSNLFVMESILIMMIIKIVLVLEKKLL